MTMEDSERSRARRSNSRMARPKPTDQQSSLQDSDRVSPRRVQKESADSGDRKQRKMSRYLSGDDENQSMKRSPSRINSHVHGDDSESLKSGDQMRKHIAPKRVRDQTIASKSETKNVRRASSKSSTSSHASSNRSVNSGNGSNSDHDHDRSSQRSGNRAESRRMGAASNNRGITDAVHRDGSGFAGSEASFVSDDASDMPSNASSNTSGNGRVPRKISRGNMHRVRSSGSVRNTGGEPGAHRRVGGGGPGSEASFVSDETSEMASNVSSNTSGNGRVPRKISRGNMRRVPSNQSFGSDFSGGSSNSTASRSL